MSVDIADRGEQRKFGWVMAAAFALLGLVRAVIHALRHDAWPSPPWTFLAIALAFFLAASIWPACLRPVLAAWMKLAHALNFVMTRLLLTLAFFGLFLPTALVLRVLRHDPLKRRFEPDASTYWEDPEDQPEDYDAYLNQF